MDIAIIGWVWLGIIIGMLVGMVTFSLFANNKHSDLEAEAIQMKIDYEQHPSEESGSVVVVHENSDILEEEE